MVIKNLKIFFSIILAVLGLVIFIFTNFIYGHVSWINTANFGLNTSFATILSVFVFLFGLVFLLKNTIKLFDSPPKIFYVLRKTFAIVLLGNLVGVLFYAGLLGLFLWLMFFNVALIFCLYLLFTKHNGYFFGVFFFILGLAYAVLPVFPGPFILMPEFFTIPDFSTGNFVDKMLLFHVVIFKSIVAISGCFILFTAFLKNSRVKIEEER